MLDRIIKYILIFLIIFTPVAFGSMDFWAFSLMELGILLIIILWAIQSLVRSSHTAFHHVPRRVHEAQLSKVWKDYGVTVMDGGETHSNYIYVIDGSGMLVKTVLADSGPADIAADLDLLLR